VFYHIVFNEVSAVSKPRRFEKPIGVKDILPEIALRKRHLERQVQDCMHLWGYSEIITPTLEYYDTVGGASATLDDKLFKLLDRNGKTLVLRPDMTAPIARVISSLLKEEPLPIRLSYHANVFRAQAAEAGRDAEFYQTGVELVGESSTEADAEVIALAVASLQAAGVESFKIAIGHVGFLQGLFSEWLSDEESKYALKERLLARDYVGFREGIRNTGLEEWIKSKLLKVLSLRGGRECCEQALELTTQIEARQAIQNLYQVWDVLESYDVSQYVILDLTMIGNFDYYTGMIFEAYSADHGFPVCTGGRYDNLLGQFGRPAPATGFALKMDRVLEVSALKPPSAGKKALIAYTAENRVKALAEAQKRREQQGQIVVTKLIMEEQADTFLMEGYDETIRYIGGVTSDE
jgi:ATP phosphoribosyltransferase regulatory subunit